MKLKLNRVYFWRRHHIQNIVVNDTRFVILLSCKNRDLKMVSENVGQLVLVSLSWKKKISIQIYLMSTWR